MFFMSVLLNITVSFVMILVRMFRKCERYFILKYCKSKGQHETWSSLFYLFLTLHPQTGLRDVGAEVLFANRLARCRYTVYRYTVHNENLWKINEKTPNIISFLNKMSDSAEKWKTTCKHDFKKSFSEPAIGGKRLKLKWNITNVNLSFA